MVEDDEAGAESEEYIFCVCGFGMRGFSTASGAQAE